MICPFFGSPPLFFLDKFLRSNPPPTCFLIVCLTILLSACIGLFLVVAASINSGAASKSSSLPIFFAAGITNFRANEGATLAIPKTNAPKPLFRCL